MIDVDWLQTKYNKIWDNFTNDMVAKFNSKAVYDKKYLKIEMKSRGGKKIYRFSWLSLHLSVDNNN